MSDRGGNCKFFAPNYFNPTKCQNCFKPKEQHAAQEVPVSGKQTLNRKSSSLGKNVAPPKKLLKESILLKGIPKKDKMEPEVWNKYWYSLFSNGELIEYELVDNKASKENIKSTIMLQDFVRMLDGKQEIKEDLCFGLKALRDTIYYKTITRVDYENWWKEFSTFVAAPLKRTTSTASSLRSSVGSYSKPGLTKQFSMPAHVLSSKGSGRSSRSSSVSSIHSEPEHPQMETLRNQVSKLEEENSKLSKTESERRKLVLEVNYWKEYVTNSQNAKRSGVSIDMATELADTRKKLIQLQDELNETQKKLKMHTGKVLMQNKDLTDNKEKLREANSIIAVHKAKIDQLLKELLQRDQQKQLVSTVPAGEIFYKGENNAKLITEVAPSSVPVAAVDESAQHLEDKFLVLKDRLKRIERELFLKSKELEKANESRSKVAKYTRTLLQELETRLGDNQNKLAESDQKLKNVETELAMERERRIKLEEGPRRRMSSIASPGGAKLENREYSIEHDPHSPPTDLTEHDADTKYADYYRSRYKEAEESLLEKDKKLHQAEEKIKEIQMAMKSNSDSYKLINELQTKLSDATHKLSDRQLKIHELTREIDKLKGYEKTYEKMSKKCETLEEINKDLEKINLEKTKNLHHSKQELEILKIREVVLKEQLQTFAEDSENSDEEEEGEDHRTLHKSIDLKNKIECLIEAEALVKKLTFDNEKLVNKNNELERRLKNINIQSFKTLESNKLNNNTEGIQITNTERDKYETKIKELEQKISDSQDTLCNELTVMKEKHYDEILNVEKLNYEKLLELKDKLSDSKQAVQTISQERNDLEGECNELRGKLTMLDLKMYDVESQLKVEQKLSAETEALFTERTNLYHELEAKFRKTNNEIPPTDEKINHNEKLSDENHDLKMKVRQLDRKLRVSLERFEDVMASISDKGIKLDGKTSILVSEEIQSLAEAFKKDNYENNILNEQPSSATRDDSEETFFTPPGSVSYNEPESIEKYKKNSNLQEMQIKELRKKLISSEEKCIKIAEDLERHIESEEEYILNYNLLEARMNDIQSQIIESQKSLQSKADDLERERKNVINLVEATSAYIKELEGSIAESKTKIIELQNLVELTKEGNRPAPEGSAGNIIEEVDLDDDVKVVRQKSTAKILLLQSDISELKVSHANEIKNIQAESQDQLQKLRAQVTSAGVNEDSEDLLLKVENLQAQINEQKDAHAKEVSTLHHQFQTELKAAFGSDNNSMEMLNRVQELEIEIEETRKDNENRINKLKDEFEKEKQEMKDDMATVLQARFSLPMSDAIGTSSEPRSSAVEDLEERIIKLEQELVDMQERYEEELSMEKEAHQREMEDTIRDMMMVHSASNRYDDGRDEPDTSSCHGSFRGSDTSKMVSSEEVENLKLEYEKKLQLQQDAHYDELDQVRQDMAIVITSLKHDDSSETIVELQHRIKELEQELDFSEERAVYEAKFKRLESANFFAARRNEEMGSKIYQMQNELEEMDRTHRVEIQAYQDKLASLGNEDEDSVNECLIINKELEEKNRELEKELEHIHKSRDSEMDAFEMQLQKEKREAVEEMTDQVLKLEALIEEIKATHEQDIKEFEKLNRSERMQTQTKENMRIRELEMMCDNLKEEYEEEIEELAKEHKITVEKLRVFYEKEIGETKKRSVSEIDMSPRKPSIVDQTVKQIDKHEKEIETIKNKCSARIKELEAKQQREINDIRFQYDEKLKMNVKEGMRRQSLTERKSDGTRMRELIAQKDAAETKALELEIRYENDTKELKGKIIKLQKIINDLKNGGKDVSLIQKELNTLTEDDALEDDSQKKLKEIQDQIERFERRIEYYREKSQRENCEESHRVTELQTGIVELHQQMNSIMDNKRKEAYEKEKKEKAPGARHLIRRNTDGSTPRRHTDTETDKISRKKERDPRKRWSNLEERTEKEEGGKSGSVLARKTLWENISVDEPTAKSSIRTLVKTASSSLK